MRPKVGLGLMGEESLAPVTPPLCLCSFIFTENVEVAIRREEVLVGQRSWLVRGKYQSMRFRAEDLSSTHLANHMPSLSIGVPICRLEGEGKCSLLPGSL